MVKRMHKGKRETSRVGVLSQALRDLAYAKGPDTKLPTVRELCTSFNTSQATVVGALDELELQNVLYRRPGNGIFVSPKLYCKNISVLINAAHVDKEGVSPFWGILWGKLVKEGQRR